MKAIGARIRELRKAKGFAQQPDFAKHAHVSAGLISEMERGEAGARVALQSYLKVAEALGIDFVELITGEPPLAQPQEEEVSKKLDKILGSEFPKVKVTLNRLERLVEDMHGESWTQKKNRPKDAPRVPIYGKVAAGMGAENPVLTADPKASVPVPAWLADLPGRLIGLRAVGDSMEPIIYEGDIVVAWYGGTELLRRTARQGDLFVITDTDHEEFVKKVAWTDEFSGIFMESINPKYMTQTLPYELIRYAGLVVMIIRKTPGEDYKGGKPTIEIDLVEVFGDEDAGEHGGLSWTDEGEAEGDHEHLEDSEDYSPPEEDS